VGGNHEASNHLWELHLGGWVAPNIYYLGAAGAVRFGGLRIAGLSGIFKSGHFGMGHFERPPYTDSTMRSAYHVRATDVNRLLRLEGPTDVFLSHDWPAGVARHGDAPALFRKKPFLRREVEDGSLGSPPAAQVLAALRPAYWFAAHLHTKFAALVPHPGAAPTRFLSLDKCLPGRSFLQVVDFPEAQGPRQVEYDAEWLAVLRATHGLTCLRQRAPPPPPPQPPTEAEVEAVRRLLAARGGPAVPPNFVQTAPPHDAAGGAHQRGRMPRGGARNPQTVALLEMLGLPYNLDPQGEAAAASGAGRGTAGPAEPNPEEIDIGDDEPMDAEDAVNPEEIDLDGSEGEPDAVDPALAAILAGAS
jgi:lariat debranching enzyme